MKVFNVKVKVFGRHGWIPLAATEWSVKASAAHTAVYYVMRELKNGPLKGKRPTSFNITVAEIAVLPKKTSVDTAEQSAGGAQDERL